MDTLTIIKKGRLKFNKFSSTQCKIEGHRKFKYKVQMTCSVRLDKNDFLIDNSEIHKAATSIESDSAVSCELLAIRIHHLVAKKMKEHGCEILKGKISITPIEEKPTTKIIYKYELG